MRPLSPALALTTLLVSGCGAPVGGAAPIEPWITQAPGGARAVAVTGTLETASQVGFGEWCMLLRTPSRIYRLEADPDRYNFVFGMRAEANEQYVPATGIASYRPKDGEPIGVVQWLVGDPVTIHGRAFAPTGNNRCDVDRELFIDDVATADGGPTPNG